MNREEYIDKLTGKLKEWNSEIKKLEAKAQEAGTDAKKAMSKEITELRTKKKVLENKLEEVKDAGDDSWKEIQTEAEKAYNNMKSALKNAVNRFQNV